MNNKTDERFDLDWSPGQATLPLEDYNGMREEIRRLQGLCDALRNDNTALRVLFADLKLPSPDVIDKDSIDIIEQTYVGIGDPLTFNEFNKRRRIIRFDYKVPAEPPMI